MKKNIFLLLFICFTFFFILGCENNERDEIILSLSSEDYYVGDSCLIKVETSSELLYKFSISDESKCYIENSTLYFTKEGKTIIKVYLVKNESIYDEIIINIKEKEEIVTSIKLNLNKTYYVGSVTDIFITDNNNKTIPLKDLTITINNNVARINEDKIEFINSGIVVVNVDYPKYELKDTIQITVLIPSPQEITFMMEDTFYPNDTFSLEPIFIPSYSRCGLELISSDDKIAKVEGLKVTFLAPGIVTITLSSTDKDLAYSKEVTVLKPTLIDLDFLVNETYEEGEEITVSPIFYPEYSEIDVMLSSSDQSLAFITNMNVKFLKEGKVSLTLESLNGSFKCVKEILITKKTPESISFICNDEYNVKDSFCIKTIFNPVDSYCDIDIEISNKDIAILDDNLIIFKKSGTIEISISSIDKSLSYSKIVTINDLVKEINLNLLDEYSLGSTIVLDYNIVNGENTDDVLFTIKPSSFAKINGNYLTFNNAGTCELIATLVGNNDVLRSHTIEIKDDISTFVVKKTLEKEVIIDNYVYFPSQTVFESISELFEYTSDVTKPIKIIFMDDIIDYEIIIPKDNLYLTTLNDNQIWKSKLIVNENINNVMISGLHFVENGRILLNGGNQKISIVDCSFSLINSETDVWSDGNSYKTGAIAFKDNTSFSDEIVIKNNSFYSVSDDCINLAYILNYQILNNTFENFEKDAIRYNNGIISKKSHWLIKDNSFVNGKYNGIFFRTYASTSKAIENIISIYDNTFYNTGIVSSLYSNAITFKINQEGTTNINISYNTFRSDGTSNYIMLRNNAVLTNQDNFTSYITYNNFIGKPKKSYIANKNSSDTISTNPDQAELSYNFYGDLDNKQISIGEVNKTLSGVKTNKYPFSSIIDHNKLPKIYGSNVIYINNTSNIVFDSSLSIINTNPNCLRIDTKGFITPISLGTSIIECTNEYYTLSFPIIIKDEITYDYIKRIIEIGINENGYHEGENNYSKYGVWYGSPNSAWCAIFVSWCANQAGISTSIIPKYASVSTGMKWFQDHGLFEYKENYRPKAGDIIFYKSDGASHTGIVISSDEENVYTVEGNTSDQVKKRTLPLTYSKITGYGLPEYPKYDGTPYVFDITGFTSGEFDTTT